MTLTIVGLGPGDIDDLSRKAWRVLKQAQTVYLRTAQHGCVACLPQMGAVYHSFDAVYEQSVTFEEVYSAIVDQVIAAAQVGDVVYAVPGDPLVGESTTPLLRLRAAELGIAVQIVNGISFVEPCLALLGVDALDGLQVMDGLVIGAMHHPPLNPDYPALIGQVYSRAVASEVKLTLMNQYPDGHVVMLVHHAGTDRAQVERVRLYEIDRSAAIEHTTSLYVPALGEMSSFEQFQEVVAHLRAPEGCPWDRRQTHESLRPYLIEEAYEVLEAIDNGDWDELAKELGDLLLQVVLHTQIAVDEGEFLMGDVLRQINAKMIRRHPHVWSTVKVDGAEQVVANWQTIKEAEKAAAGKVAGSSVLDGVPRGLPALMQAEQYQRKAARVGFDWPVIDQVREKIIEELDEVLAAQSDSEALFKEFGDLLFSVVNWGRWLQVNPEDALRLATHKFVQRFHYVEARAAEAGQPVGLFSLAQLDVWWNAAKAARL